MYERAKRVIDIAISLLILGGLSPLWTTIMLAIRFTSRGPLFFVARAVGRNGREFNLFKFRTMRHGSDDAAHRQAIQRFVGGEPLDVVARDGERQPIYKTSHDPRVTGIGRILRKLGLDEIPQFVNVLRGEMSVVGPRPPMVYEYAAYDPRYRGRLAVPVGITGLYQVTARSMVPFERMFEIDLDYIARRSLRLDFWILLMTPRVMLTGRGAY